MVGGRMERESLSVPTWLPLYAMIFDKGDQTTETVYLSEDQDTNNTFIDIRCYGVYALKFVFECNRLMY